MNRRPRTERAARAVSPSIDLPPEQVHLWCAFTEDLGAPSLVEQYRHLLGDDERRREADFRTPDARQRYVITRALVRTMLSRYVRHDPRAWAFATTEHGRPYIANAEGSARGLVFNLSHTRGLVVLGVTREHALGVDVEHQERPMSPGVMHRIFSTDEVAAIDALPVDRHARHLLQHWTLKEAYIKARGMGLALALRHVSFDMTSEERIRFAPSPEVDDDPDRWRFWQQQVGEYVVAVCAEGSGLQLVTRRVGALG